jgi:hypothetical protein
MNMTEDEARKKECPQHLIMMTMIQINGVKEGVNEQIIKDAGKFGYCSGSDCMMWVWDISPKSAAEINARGNAKAIPSGHCGLIKEGE